jgi:serine/threonine protein kinase
VSPDNVWLDDRHVAHLGDFDSAITGADAGPGGLWPITTGTFAAPEEREGRSLDVRSDLFSLGGVLYFVATGTRPGDVGLLRSRRPDLPSSFGDLVASLLSESPDDRPQDAESVLQRLDEIRSTSNVDALIAAGESDHIEFKSSLDHLYGPLPPEQLAKLELGKVTPQQAQTEARKGIQTAVTKTIAAFLNTGGGTLLIGVDDSGTVHGIEPDFEHCPRGKQDADGWLSSLKNVIINALGPDVWSAINVSLVPHQQKTVAVVRCPRRTIPTWHGKDGGERFYIRAPNATEELTGPSLVSYIHEHWPA